MPYGLALAPSIFQKMINEVLRDFLDKCVIAYLNDILIYFGHVKHVHLVLQRLLQHQLYVEVEKCELFFKKSISFLGYNINITEVSMDNKKMKTVLDWPTPQTVKELLRFLGFLRFIRNYSTIAAPFTSSTNGGKKRFSWNMEWK